MLSSHLQNKIIDSIKPFKPLKIILFGSHAYGETDEGSDIDLLIVLDDNSIPATHEEYLSEKVKLRKALAEINREYAIDLVVYTSPLFREFISRKSQFSKEILQKGIVLYEKGIKGVA